MAATFSTILTAAVQAIMISALYALVAVGFTLIFGVGGVLNLAHGASIAIGAFSAYYAVSVFGFGIVGGLLAALVVPAIFGALLYLGPIRKFQDRPVLVMILTLVVAVAVERVFLAVEGASSQTIPLLVGGTTQIASASVQNNLLLIFLFSWLAILALFYWITRTDTGRAILAVSQDRKGAFLVGIDSGRINLLMWTLAGVLAGLAGFFLASQQGVRFDIGRAPLVLSFAIVVLGGLGSIRGSVVGAYVIGTLEILTIRLVSPNLSGLAPLVALILVLLIRPAGLFGREEVSS
jgi:branched-chain amino acid transport system permease protein